MSLSSIADAANAISRLYGVFEAELLDDTHIVDPDLEVAIEVKGASFTWDAPPPEEDDWKKKKKGGARSKKPKALPGPTADEGGDAEAKVAEDPIFKVQNVDLAIPRGKLVAIVGPVGSGKTSLLQGIIGEMRKTSGTITFGGSVGYCAQSAWIQVRSQLTIPMMTILMVKPALLECNYSRKYLFRSTFRGGEVLESCSRFLPSARSGYAAEWRSDRSW